MSYRMHSAIWSFRYSSTSFHGTCLPLSLFRSRASPNAEFASTIETPNYAKSGYASAIEVPGSIEIPDLLYVDIADREAYMQRSLWCLNCRCIMQLRHLCLGSRAILLRLGIVGENGPDVRIE
ncbi:hypothetical protein VTP01DRAFT_9463 [Rhizomucor pusillus]|uniref:uncharacterized protein n=1 Tax=Rhizomucor pusillus TaxID=4840 RepID=UPI003742266F